MARTHSISPRNSKNSRYRSVADKHRKLKQLKRDDGDLPYECSDASPCEQRFANEAGMKNHARYHVNPQNPGYDKLSKQNIEAALKGYPFMCSECPMARPRRTKTKWAMRKHYRLIHGWIPAAKVDHLMIVHSSRPRPPPPPPPPARPIKKSRNVVVKCSCGSSMPWNKTLIKAHVEAHTPEHADASFEFVLGDKTESTTFYELMHDDAPPPRISKY